MNDCMISHFICVFSTVTTARCSSSCISALQSFKPLSVGFENVRYKGCASFSTTATYAIRNICLHSLLSTHAHAHAHSGFKLLLTSASSKSVTLLDAAAHITPRLQVKLKRSYLQKATGCFSIFYPSFYVGTTAIILFTDSFSSWTKVVGHL